MFYWVDNLASCVISKHSDRQWRAGASTYFAISRSQHLLRRADRIARFVIPALRDNHSRADTSTYRLVSDTKSQRFVTLQTQIYLSHKRNPAHAGFHPYYFKYFRNHPPIETILCSSEISASSSKQCSFGFFQMAISITSLTRSISPFLSGSLMSYVVA